MSLNLRQLITALEEMEAAGNCCLPAKRDLVRLAYGNRAGDEFDSRERIVRRMAAAKRDAGFPLGSNFFDDVWPKALAALMEKKTS